MIARNLGKFTPIGKIRKKQNCHWHFICPVIRPENLTIYVPDAYKDKFEAAWINWKVKGETYTVSFDGGRASGRMESVEGISGDYVLPESGFTYQSAILDCWALDNPDGEKAGCPGDIFPVTENVVLYASWRLVIVIPEPENPVVCIHAWGEWQSNADQHWKKCIHCEASDIRKITPAEQPPAKIRRCVLSAARLMGN